MQVKDVDEALEHAMESMELCKSNITTTHPLNPRGVLLGILAESVPPCYLRPKNVIFTPVFRPGLQEMMSSLLRLEHQQKVTKAIS